MSNSDYSHLGKSLFRSRHYRVTVLHTSLSRWSQSRVLGQKRVLVLFPEPILSAGREGSPVLLFSCALFRSQSTCDIADSKALPQTTLLLLVRVNVDSSNDTSSSLVIVQLVLFFPSVTFISTLATVPPQILLDITWKGRKRDTKQTRLSRVNRSFAPTDVV